jgi:hypothetical protein
LQVSAQGRLQPLPPSIITHLLNNPLARRSLTFLIIFSFFPFLYASLFNQKWESRIFLLSGFHLLDFVRSNLLNLHRYSDVGSSSSLDDREILLKKQIAMLLILGVD